MSVTHSGLTDVGHKRDHNEDFFVIDEEAGLYVLCDGMGGHAAGEVASEMAANTVRDVVRNGRAAVEALAANDTPETRAAVTDLVVRAGQRACADVFAAAQADPSKAGMGTTLEMVIVAGRLGVMGHVGDSRLYMKRDGEVHQLSEDHSFVQEMVRAGMFTPEEARTSPVSNVITRAIGIHETVQVDTLIFDLLPGDTLLLCSDGLSDYMKSEGELASLITEGPLAADAERLVELANERGGKDNITTVLIRAEPREAPDRRPTARDAGSAMEVLKRVRVLKHLSYEELVRVLNITLSESHDAGVAVVSEGDKSSDFYIVLSGELEASQHGHALAEFGQGDHFGEMELIVPRSRSATVTTKSPAELLKIRRDDFIALIKEREHTGMKLLWSFLQTMSLHLHHTNLKLSSVMDDEEITSLF